MVTTAIVPEKTVSDDHRRDTTKGRGHRDDGHEEEIQQADNDTKRKKVTHKRITKVMQFLSDLKSTRLEAHGVREEFTAWCKARTSDLTVAVETGSEEKVDLKGEFCSTRSYQRVSPDQDP